MLSSPDFRTYCEAYFARLCFGYDQSLDDSRIRAWLHGHKNPSDSGGAWDMSTRMFASLAAWLSNPERPRAFFLRGHKVDVEQLVRSVLINAFDPEKPGFWGRDLHQRREQRTVESSMLAYGAWLLRDTKLHGVPARALECFQQWLEYFGSGDLVRGNWNLFWIVNHAARKALGWKYDQAVIDTAWERIEALEREDGWLTDGHENHFDDYNWWVFGTHEAFWAQMDGANNPERARRIVERTRKRLEVFPHFFGANGSYSEYGRSLSYKFARLGTPLHALREGYWPHSRGMLKRLVRRHLGFYDDNGAIDRRFDTVRQELSEVGHPGVRDNYINTGHPYWCMHGFVALWQIPDNDPFWTCEEEPLPIEQEDFSRTVKSAGWIVMGDKAGGQVLRYNLGTQNGHGDYAAKYGKFMYGSHFPVDFGTADGDYGPDSVLCLTDGDHWAHPGDYDAFATAESYLRGRYTLGVGKHSIVCETILIPRGTACLRIHKIKVPKQVKSLLAVEGGAALGYQPGTTASKDVDAKKKQSLVWNGNRASLIRGIKGYTRAVRAQGFRGNDRLNGIWDRAVTPTLEAKLPSGKEALLVSWTLAVTTGLPKPLQDPKVSVMWKKNGDVELTWDGRKLKVPALKK